MSRGLGYALLILAVAALLGLGLGVLAGDSPAARRGAMAGALLAGLGGAAGLVWIVRAREGEKGGFLRAVFGGMLLRLLAYGAALVVVHRAGSWSLAWFVGGVLGTHFAGQVIEIVALIRLPASAAASRGGPER